MKKLLKFSGIVIAATIIVGCGGSSNQVSNNTGTGYYEDSAIVGINYKCGNQTGITGNNGEFVFDINKSCVFSLGDVVIEKRSSSEFKNKKTIHIEINNDYAKYALALLDKDGNLDNGFQIDTNAAKYAFKKANITKFDSNITSKLKDIATNYEEKLNEKGVSGYKYSTIEELKQKLDIHQKKQLKDILAGKTFYLIETYFNENTSKPKFYIGEFNFDKNFTKITWKDENITDTYDINITNGKIILYNMNEELELANYDNKSITIKRVFDFADGSKSKPCILILYKNRVDAEKKVKEKEGYYNITEAKVKALVGTTLYKARVSCNNSIEIGKLEIKKDKMYYTGPDGNGSVSYKIDNNKIIVMDGNKTITAQVVYISDEKVVMKTGNSSNPTYKDYYKTKELAIEKATPNYDDKCYDKRNYQNHADSSI